MNTPNQALTGETDATGGDLRPSETSPRPIPHPSEHPFEPIEGTR
jgi:hypothetical protein